MNFNPTLRAGLLTVILWNVGNLAWARKPAAETSPSLSRLYKAVENALPEGKLGKNAGIYAISLEKGDVLYARNEDERLIPASTCKVFTAYTALKKLKPNATFKTSLHATGPVRDGQLIGDLYVKGGGDPSLVSERLWMLVNDFWRSGIRTVSGNIVGDSSYFDEEKNPESRPKYLKDQAYNAPVGALSFNFNTTTVYVKPAEKPGLPPVTYIDPQNSYVNVVNQATTGKVGSTPTIAASRTDYVQGDTGDILLLRGSIPLDGKELRYYRNIVNPTLYACSMLKTFMEQRGIKIQGHVQEGKVPESARTLVEFESQPLWQVVWGMNKFSNNFVADQIMKKIGAEVWGPPGTLQKGLSAVEDALGDIGIPKNSYHIEDGSGLTRKTRVTAKQLVTVLRSAHRDFSISGEFVASLGIAGEDGTLRNRFPSSKGVTSIRAKTGTLDGVTALAGYAQTLEGELIAFAVILNDPPNKHGRMTAWADSVALALTRFSRESKE